MEAERTIKNNNKKEQIRGRLLERCWQRGQVWSFVQCTLAWFERPLLGAARIFILFKRTFLHLQDSVTRPSFTG